MIESLCGVDNPRSYYKRCSERRQVILEASLLKTFIRSQFEYFENVYFEENEES